ncbi:DUF4011 domain-containing protein [Lacipirellula sp.]|uniref:DUF4011 domain-containing protein n=1 Tax=Lacipirellula sp. TaxID=2691419 RepID=UPI003D10AA43
MPATSLLEEMPPDRRLQLGQSSRASPLGRPRDAFVRLRIARSILLRHNGLGSPGQKGVAFGFADALPPFREPIFMSQVDLSAELNRFRERLLDLSNRNPLLNYRISRTRTLEIIDERPEQVYQRLVIDGKRFRFDPLPEVDVEEDSETSVVALTVYNEEFAASAERTAMPSAVQESPSNGERVVDEARYNDDRLQTRLSAARLETVAKGIAGEAVTIIEETGVNYLFLAMGMLGWRETDQAEKEHLAPLLLVPVTIDRSFNGRTLKYEYAVSWQGDELQWNLSLSKKLERDFGLRLPEYDGEQPPESYFLAVEQVIRSKPNWIVKREQLIGFFAFQKMLMYLDLEPDAWENRGALHPDGIAATIIAGHESDAGSNLYAPDYDIDELVEAKRISLISDCDSSQHSALVDIINGKNLVIEGPPGTGKSQTITNAIAAALHEGKTVLFVAEKLAALKVVSDRLSELGMGGFCLELHSDAGPKRVYQSLKERMNAIYNKPHALEDVRRDLERKKATVADYLSACATPIGPYQEPFYQAVWRTIELRSRGVRSARQVSFNADVNRADFDENAQLLEAFVETLNEVESPRQNPWWGFWTTTFNPNDLEPVATLLKRLGESAADARRECDALHADCGEGLLQWISASDHGCVKLASALGDDANDLPSQVPLKVLREPAVRALAKEFHSLVLAAKELASESSQYMAGERADAELSSGEVRRLIERQLMPTAGDTSIKILRVLKSRVSTLLTVLNSVDAIVGQLQSQGLEPIRNLKEYQQSEELFRLLRHPILKLITELPPSLFLANAPVIFKQARSEATSLVATREELGKAFQLDALPEFEKLRTVSQRLRPHADRWWRFLSKDFRTGKKELLTFSRSGIGSTPVKWIERLEELEDHLASERKFGDRNDLKQIFGSLFNGTSTDWEQAGTLLKWAATVTNRGLDHASAGELLRHASGALRAQQIIEARQQLAAELAQPGVAKALGVATPFETESLVEFRRRSDALLADIKSFESAANPLTLSDELTLSEISRRVDVILESKKLRERCLDPSLWKSLESWNGGLETDCEGLWRAVDWVERASTLKLPAEAMERLVGESAAPACRLLATRVESVQRVMERWKQLREQLSASGRADESWLPLIDAESGDVIGGGLTEALAQQIDELPEWSAFCRMLLKCESARLATFTNLAMDEQVEVAHLADCYRLSVMERAVESKLWSTPTLKEFSRQSLEKAREQFKHLDRQLLQFTQDQIAHDASKRPAPPGNSKGRVAEYTELGLVRHEIQKQKRHCRIRDLLSRAGTAVQSLKPCFMMSPLSVAQYLAPEGVQFDLVIMDEASQIKPEDALGTLLRAKQIVVVGDPKQLPPTSFFDRVDDGVVDEEATPLDNAESILEVAMKTFQPVRRLRWHYRSQHESLIHFSNDRFYDRDLIVFPSASTESSSLGFRYHFVENASFVGSCNVEEAKVVAAAIIEHAKRAPHETLGVGTFNMKQRDCIRECLDKLCEQDATAREAVDRLNENHDKLFIKNLENLQGDERDVIFISYTYGPDRDSGKVMNRFGPITGVYGWRRLNVLITRARRRVEVFTSMRSSDILGGPDRSLGVNAMKDYLEFARTGTLPDRGLYTGKAPDSPFEISVASVITRMGLKVVPQVGVAGYFIDMGVLHPEKEGDFLLGIECDGATYHSAKSARDRDRLREEVIKRRGWTLHRIWSTDWFLNQKHEEDRLTKAIQAALSC